MVWWKRFGMIREPNLNVFPLSTNNAHLFVEPRRSVTLNALLSKLDDPMLTLQKTYAIIGSFGSGKTTTVAYIRYQFHLKSLNVCSINVNWDLRPTNGVHDVRNWFFDEMKKQLVRICNDATEGNGLKAVSEKLAEKQNIDEADVIDTIRALQPYYNGFILLIDELHREEEANKVQHILDFLKSLQSFFTEMCKYPVAFFVSSHENWEKNLKLDRYSGIFTDLIVLPPWTVDDAYVLIDKRLRDAAADRSRFKNPLKRSSLEKLETMGLVKTFCPRQWIVLAKRIFESVPQEVDEISPIVVTRIFSQIDTAKIGQIRQYASSECPNVLKLISPILEADAKDAIKLLAIVAFMYHVDISRPITDEACKKIGIEELPLMIETLKEKKIVHEGRRTSTPRKVGKGAVEILYQEVYRLHNTLKEFFEKVEEKFGLEPEDYLIRFVEHDVYPLGKERIFESEASLQQMERIIGKLTIQRARNHLASGLEDYKTFISSIFSSLTLNKAVIRSGIMTMFSILAAFIVEKTRDMDHAVNVEEDLKVLKIELNTGEKTAGIVLNLYTKFKKIDESGAPISEELSNSVKERIPRVVSKLLDPFEEWVSKSPSERLALETKASVDKIEKKILRDHDVLRKGAFDYLATLTEQRDIRGIDEKWLNAFFEFLAPKGLDAVLMEIVDIRCNPQLYPVDRSQAFKTALYKTGLAFENILMIIGRNHTDPKTRGFFVSATKMTVEFMLGQLFKNDEALKSTVRSYGSFDRSRSRQDFESKIEMLLDDTLFDGVPQYIRYYATSVLVRNYYSHEGCEDTNVNKNEAIFQQVVNQGLLSILSIFRHSVNRRLIANFQVP